MKKIFYFLPVLFFLLSSCSPDSESNDGKENDGMLSSFDGTFRNGENTFSGAGVVEVDDSEFAFTNQYGTLTGEAVLQADDEVNYYEIEVTEGTGIFDNLNQMSGEMYNDYVHLSGSDDSGGTLEVSGELMTIEELNQQWSNERNKSSVVFTNLEMCRATIAINGETLGPLGIHYAVNGLCNPMYEIWREISVDVDNATSNLFCHEFTLEMQDGSMQTFEVCDVATFVLDKNTSFEYTVEWENGEITSGSFTSPDGGKQKFICLENGGIECEVTEEEEEEEEEYGTYIISQSLTLNGNSIEYEQSSLGHYYSSMWVGDSTDDNVPQIEVSPIIGDSFSEGLVIDRFSLDDVEEGSAWRVQVQANQWDEYSTIDYEGNEQGHIVVTEYEEAFSEYLDETYISKLALEFVGVKCQLYGTDKIIEVSGAITINSVF